MKGRLMKKEFIHRIELSLNKEIWKPLIYYGHPTWYEISNMGRVKSVRFLKTKHVIHEKIIQPCKSGKYLAVNLFIDKKMTREYIHRLVAMVFIPVPEALINQGYTMRTLDVNHILGGDENKHLNTVDNLEWVTRSDNKYHDYNTGIQPIGENSHLATKNKEYQIHNVCKLLEGNQHTVNEISKITGVSLDVVYDVLYGGSWKSVSSKYKLSNYSPKNKKHSDETIGLVRKYISDGLSVSEISSKMNMSYACIWRICKRYIW